MGEVSFPLTPPTQVRYCRENTNIRRKTQNTEELLGPPGAALRGSALGTGICLGSPGPWRTLRGEKRLTGGGLGAALPEGSPTDRNSDG